MYAAGQGSENPIPLSPQWLLPKLGESKPGALSGVCSYHCHDIYQSVYQDSCVVI